MLKETDTEHWDQFNNIISKPNKLHYSKQDSKMKGTVISVECCLGRANLVIVNAGPRMDLGNSWQFATKRILIENIRFKTFQDTSRQGRWRPAQLVEGLQNHELCIKIISTIQSLNVSDWAQEAPGQSTWPSYQRFVALSPGQQKKTNI